MNSPEIEQFLTDLAVEKNVSPSTQNQALAALLFLYQEVLHKPLERRIDAVRAKKAQRLPVGMSKAEVTPIVLRRTYSKMGTTFEPFKSCWTIRAWPRP